MTAQVSSHLIPAPFQIVIRKSAHSGYVSPVELAGINDTKALELANLINAWFSKHEHAYNHAVDPQTDGVQDTLITGIYLHITYKETD